MYQGPQSTIFVTGRDRLIHVFNATKNYEPLDTLDCHTSSGECPYKLLLSVVHLVVHFKSLYLTNQLQRQDLQPMGKGLFRAVEIRR